MYTPSKELCMPFILTETNIRRIVKIIEDRRSPELEGYDPIFKYKRLDDYERETSDLNDLLSEDNRGETRIVSLTISTDRYIIADSGLHYEIEFNSCENTDAIDLGFAFFKSVTFGVKGENRDVSELLFNDLNTYIKNSIISHKYRLLVSLFKTIMPIGPISFVFPTMFLLFITMISYVLIPSDRNKLIEDAIVSTDISEKLNALLQLNKANDLLNFLSFLPLLLLIILIATVVLVLMNSKIKKKLYSALPFVFNFGQYPEDYNSRISVVKTILGIIGTLCLGLLGNFIYAIISNFLK